LLLLVDDMSRFTWLVLLATKDEAFGMITAFKARVEAEVGKKIGILHTDRDGEFTTSGFTEYCSDHGVQRHLTTPYTPEQNGVAKRRNQSVLGMARSMLQAMTMPNWFEGGGGEAVITVVFILNRSPMQSINGKLHMRYGTGKTIHSLLLYFRMCCTHEVGEQAARQAQRLQQHDGVHWL
jgi:transposase InsO family protein